MNNTLKFLIVILLCGFSISSFSQEITQENFEKERNEIWNDSEKEMQKIVEIFNENPEEKDILIIEAKKIEKQTYQKWLQASVKYLSLPNTLNFIYNIRNEVPKDSLQCILNSLSNEQRISEYAVLIQKHIDTEQIKEGDDFFDFEATNLNGEKFVLSSLKSKNIMFFYGGLGCMGENGRNYLKTLYDSTSRENFEVVIYCTVESLEEMKEEAEMFSADYILVSDFLLDHSPIKIKYGTQATPTCFFINEPRIVELISIGLSADYLNKQQESK